MPTRRSFLGSSLALAAGQAFSADTSRIRIAQIGTQHAHAGGKMEAIRRFTDLYEVVALANTEDSKSELYAGLPRLGVDELLALPGLKAVTVETRLEDSCSTALKAIRAGKHVHLDKPGAVNHAEFTAMRNEAEQRGLTVQMGYMLRYNPAFVAVFEAAKQGWLGEITEIDAMMGKLADPATRKKIGELEGGGFFELACHVLDVVHTLLGKPTKVHACSTPTLADGVKDNQLALLEYPKATVTIRCNHADPFGGPRRRFQVTGTKGSIEIQPLESGEFVARFTSACGPYKKGEQKVKLDVPKGRYDGEFIDLAKIIHGEKKLAWDAAHDIAVHETLLRASGIGP
jgi:predicted dehydrogenase